MNCQTHESTVTSCTNQGSNNWFLVIVVLYILLAIIIGSRNGANYY